MTLPSVLLPCVSIDAETSGLNPEEDRIVQLGLVRQHVDGTTTKECWLINPGVPIPPEATLVHAITDDMVKDAPPIRVLWTGVMEMLEGCKSLTGFRVRTFDLQMLDAEWRRSGMTGSPPWDGIPLIDSADVEARLEPRKLVDVYERRTGKKLEGAHDAGVDARAALDVLACQFKAPYAHKSIPLGAKDFATWSLPDGAQNWVDRAGKLRFGNDGSIVFGFGQHEGESISHVARQDPGYIARLYYKATDLSFTVRRHLRYLLSEFQIPEWACSEGKLLRNSGGQLVIGFGKYKGTLLSAVDRGWKQWALDGDLPDDCKALVRASLNSGNTAKQVNDKPQSSTAP